MNAKMTAVEKALVERAMAQDYWVQVVTNMTERAQLITDAPKAPRRAKLTVASMYRDQKINYSLLMDYIFETRREAVLAHAKKLQNELDAILNAS